MPGSLLGNVVRRIEDPELLTGEGTFVGNLRVDGLLHAAFVRSPFAHAEIVSIDAADALALPGVVAVLTAADLAVEPYHPFVVLSEAVPRPPLASGRVRFVGDPVAVVIAESADRRERRRRPGRRRLRVVAVGDRHGGGAGTRRPARVRRGGREPDRRVP